MEALEPYLLSGLFISESPSPRAYAPGKTPDGALKPWILDHKPHPLANLVKK
jgi:hypothetical protein